MSNRRLREKVALVTGAGRGIGRAIALGYANEGASIAAVARTASELDSLRDEIRSLGGKILTLCADLSIETVSKSLVADAARAFGTIDVLVNNAGIGTAQSSRPAVDFDDAYWDLTLN